jgi:hypothetical protein
MERKKAVKCPRCGVDEAFFDWKISMIREGEEKWMKGGQDESKKTRIRKRKRRH